MEVLVDDGAKLLDEILVSLAGVEFDRDLSGELIFTQEAAHSKRRILHIGDTTGRAIMTALLRKIALKKFDEVGSIEARAVDRVLQNME